MTSSAGRGGDDHGRGPLHPLVPVAAGGATDDRGEHPQGQDARGVHPGEPLHEPLGPALLLLGLDDEVHDLGQRVVLVRSGRLDRQDARAVQRAGEHLLPDCLLDRDRLAGHRRLIERRRALGDGAVGGQALAGADQEPVTDGQVLGRHLDLLAVSQQRHRLGGQVHQRPNGAFGAGLGELLQRLGDRVEEDEHRRFAPLAQGAGGEGTDGHQQLDADLPLPDELLERLQGEEPCARHRGGDIQRR